MFFLEMQAELARTWLQLAETGTRSVSEACLGGSRDAATAWQGVVEAALPKPEPQLSFPFAQMFGSANPFLAHNPLISMMFPAMPSGWPFAGMFGQQSNPWMPAGWANASWLGLPTAVNPWANLFGANLFSSNLFGVNPWRSNPWFSLWQMPVPTPRPSEQPSLVDVMTASYRTASGHAIAAILTPFQPPPAPSTPVWTWPWGGSGRMH